MKIFMVKETKYTKTFNADGTICGQRMWYVRVLSVYDSMEKAMERLSRETKVYRPKAIEERCGYIPIDLNTGKPLVSTTDVIDISRQVVEVVFTKTGTRKVFEIETREVE